MTKSIENNDKIIHISSSLIMQLLFLNQIRGETSFYIPTFIFFQTMIEFSPKIKGTMRSDKGSYHTSYSLLRLNIFAFCGDAAFELQSECTFISTVNLIQMST